MYFISDVFEKSKVKKDAFNLIVSGCGSGKTHFVANHLLEQYPDVRPDQVLLVCSRSMIVQQQAESGKVEPVTKGTIFDMQMKEQSRFDLRDDEEWTGIAKEVNECGIRVLTYDRLIYMLNRGNYKGKSIVDQFKIVVFDECHALAVDDFVTNMAMLRMWVSCKTKNSPMLIFGLTATPDALFDRSYYFAMTFNLVLKEPIYRYHTSKLRVVTNESIGPKLAAGAFPGKALVLCQSVRECERLVAEVPNSAMLISKTHKACTDQSNYIRDYICRHEVFPPTVMRDGVEVPLKYLFVTSTAREGFNLREESGVRTIVSCYTDPVNVVQIFGRARYNIDELVIVDTPKVGDHHQADDYELGYRQLFREFVQDGNKGWLRIPEHCISPDCEIVIDDDAKDWASKLALELNQNWSGRFINTDEERESFVHFMGGYGLLSGRKREQTFAAAVRAAADLGLKVECSRKSRNGVRRTEYTLVGTVTPDAARHYIEVGRNRPDDQYKVGATLEEVAGWFSGDDADLYNDVLECLCSIEEKGYSEQSICHAIGRKRERIMGAMDTDRWAYIMHHVVADIAVPSVLKAG